MTHRVPILDWRFLPDTSGNVVVEPYALSAVNDAWNPCIVKFADTATRIGLHGAFQVPKNYGATSAALIIEWTANASTGNVVWDFEYRAVGGDDTESLDLATAQEALTSTDAAPTAVHQRLEKSVTLTAGNFTVDDCVEFILYRDGTDAADTMTAAALLFNLFFEYDD